MPLNQPLTLGNTLKHTFKSHFFFQVTFIKQLCAKCWIRKGIYLPEGSKVICLERWCRIRTLLSGTSPVSSGVTVLLLTLYCQFMLLTCPSFPQGCKSLKGRGPYLFFTSLKSTVWVADLLVSGVSVSRSVVPKSATPWTVAHQTPRFMGFFQASVLERVAISFSRGSCNPGIEPRSPAL